MSSALETVSDPKTQPSVLLFTMHRSGSMCIHTLAEGLSKTRGLDFYSANNKPPKQLPDHADWHNHGCCYGPLRDFGPLTDLQLSDYRVVVHLRDPRDVLTSMFYSYCYYHPGDEQGLTGQRKEVEARGIDDFVIRVCTDKQGIRAYGTGGDDTTVLQRYESYLEHLVDRNGVTLVKYEEMVTSFDSWLKKIMVPFEIPFDSQLRALLVLKYQKEFAVSSEDVWAHRRVVTPGDHRKKLKQKTIAQLNNMFGGVLAVLGYDA